MRKLLYVQGHNTICPKCKTNRCLVKEIHYADGTAEVSKSCVCGYSNEKETEKVVNCWRCDKPTTNWCEICDTCLDEWRQEREEWKAQKKPDVLIRQKERG